MSTDKSSAGNDGFREEKDTMGIMQVPDAALWGAQTQRSLEHFSIGKDLMPREMITAYAVLKKAAARAQRTRSAARDTLAFMGSRVPHGVAHAKRGFCLNDEAVA
jgi:fumarate hydratase class II